MPKTEDFFDTGPQPAVYLEQRAGRVTVAGWAEPRVALAATAAFDPAPWVRVDGRPGQFRAKVRGGAPGPVDLSLRVPAGSRLEVQTGSGPVQVLEVLGPVQVEAGSAAVTVAGATDVRVEAGSGAVRVERARGQIEVDTGSGGATLADVAGDVRVDGGSGPVEVARASGRRLQLDVGSGRVLLRDVATTTCHISGGSAPLTAEGLAVHTLEVDNGAGPVRLGYRALPPGAAGTVSGGPGGVTLLLPPDADVGLRVACRRGRFRSELPFQSLSHAADGGVEILVGPGSPGAARLVIESSGNVVLLPAAPGPAAPGPDTAPAPAATAPASVLQEDEVARVLEMVQAGKLTPDEANAILQALEDGEAGGGSR